VADVERALVQELDTMRGSHRYVWATLVLHEQYAPSRPWTPSKFADFDDLVQQMLERVVERIGPDDDRTITVDPARGSIEVCGEVDFVEELIAQPEIRRALHGAVLYTFPTGWETVASGEGVE